MVKKIFYLFLAFVILFSYYPFGSLLISEVEAAATTIEGSIDDSKTYQPPAVPAWGDISNVYRKGVNIDELVLFHEESNYFIRYIMPAANGSYSIDVQSVVGFDPNTKLAIYENWFDPEKPRENLIAFNDDIDFPGGNYLSQVPDLQLEQGKQYIIIVIPDPEYVTGTVKIRVFGPGTISHQETPFTSTVQYDGNGDTGGNVPQ